MKIQYRLLHDILVKTIYVKVGSLDSVTRDRFMLMTVITFDVKINWSSLLFGVLREMATPGSWQAKGYAIHICVLLRNVPGLELGESKTFPVHRVLNEKTVHRYVVINDKLGGEEVVDAPKVKRTPAKKKGVTKKRPAAGDAEVAPIVKKKRTTKGKPVSAKRLSVEEPVGVSTTSEQPVAEVAIGEREPVGGLGIASINEATTGDEDAAIEQVLAQLDLVIQDSDVERGLLVIFRHREQCIRRKYLSVSVKTTKRQRLNKSKRQRIGISQPDESYSNLLNQSQDRALEPDASYSALETVTVYSGLQNQTQDIVIQTQATVL
ncbi:patatin-like protein 2 [Dorcoceras hygrometricum]|uniref:Patatin-like protein 2 n=1 Tax=Dorcoceras hygrometricum TaxID=472368 RepID=A0A2Z7A993_9LAMI|nr:patatin-like protein 2 [Dorcoceras hygrometricum]